MSTNPPPQRAQAQRLTWEEIQRRYPDRWVVLVDLEWIDEDGDFRTAVVLGHGQHRDESLRKSAPVKAGYREFAHLYTGQIRAPGLPLESTLL